MNKSALIILSIVLACPVFAQTQRSGDEDTLKTRIVTVFDYKPTISDAKKLSEAPSIIDTTLDKADAIYTFDSRQMETEYIPDSIRAAKMKGEPLEPLYRSYVRGGIGYPTSYLLDGYVNALRSRDGALGVAIHGIGTEGVINDVPPANYNHWNTSVYGKRFLKRHQITGNFGFDRERLQYYGYSYSPDSDISGDYLIYEGNEDVFKQVYSKFIAETSIKSFYTDSSKINHEVDLHYNSFADRNGSNTEHYVTLSGQASRYLGKHLGSIGLLADYNAVNYMAPFTEVPASTDTIEQGSNFILGLNPKVTSQAKKWRLEIGLKVQLDMQENTTSTRIYPDVYAKYNLVKEVIIPYAGVTGGLERKNLSSLTQDNPFVWTAMTPLRNTDRQYHIYGGFRGSVSDQFTYNLYGGRYYEQNVPLFVNYNASAFNPGETSFGNNYFLVTYDSISTTEFGGELTYRIDEQLQVLAAGVFKDYTVTSEERPWHLPNFEVKGAAFYQLRNKIILKGEVFVIGPRVAKGYKDYVPNDPDAIDTEFFEGEPVSVIETTLKPVIDVNVGLEYRYTERLSGWVNLNNMLFQQYQVWNQYPIQRFNVMAGVTYSFWKE